MDEMQIKEEFLSEECSYIQAIEALQALGYSGADAEIIVEEWEEDNFKGTNLSY